MAGRSYDAIVIGARCAGSPTAMLLARKGHRVLLVDKATFPSDTISTHMIHPSGVAALKRWGLLDRVVATGCPPIGTYTFDFGPIVISGSPGTADSPIGYGPRRTVLDKILIDAASESGVEVREGFTVEELMFDNGRVTGLRGHDKGGETVTENARVVIGADGVNSFVAKAVDAQKYNEKAPVLAVYYSYWSGMPSTGRFDTWTRPNRGFASWPTNDGLMLIVSGWPITEFEANKKDVEGNFMKNLDLAPAFAERVRAGKREETFSGAVVPNYFRKPHGDGWALVGDAAYIKDSITAQGISDAFRDAESCANALDDTFTGRRTFGDAMSERQSERDSHSMPMYEFTYQLATLAPPPPEAQQLFGAVYGNKDAMDAFCRMSAGVLSPAEFFSEENVKLIFAAAHR